MARDLIFAMAIVIASYQLVSSEMVPYSRAGKDIVSSPINSAESPSEVSGLICGVSCYGNCHETYLMKVRERGERLAQTRQSSDPGMWLRTARQICDRHSTMSGVVRTPDGRYRIMCARLQAFLRKGNGRRTLRLPRHSLARKFNIEADSSDPRTPVKGMGVKEGLLRQGANESFMCDSSAYLDGIQCVTADCLEVDMFCVEVLVDLQLAEKLFCDSLNWRQHSPRFIIPTDPVNGTVTLDAAGSIFTAMYSYRTPYEYSRRVAPGQYVRMGSARVVPGIHILGKGEWESTILERGGSISCPDGMFVSQLRQRNFPDRRKSVRRIPRHFTVDSQFTIVCARLEQDLIIGPRIFKRAFRCDNGSFISGIRDGTIYWSYLELECRSLQCS